MAIHVVLILRIKESRVRVNKYIHKEINDKKWALTELCNLQLKIADKNLIEMMMLFTKTAIRRVAPLFGV